jgi:hypothetical protein
MMAVQLFIGPPKLHENAGESISVIAKYTFCGHKYTTHRAPLLHHVIHITHNVHDILWDEIYAFKSGLQILCSEKYKIYDFYVRVTAFFLIFRMKIVIIVICSSHYMGIRRMLCGTQVNLVGIINKQKLMNYLRFCYMVATKL